MSAAFRASATGGGTSGTGDRSATITPAVGDLLVVFVAVTGNTNNAPTCADGNTGGTYTRLRTETWGGGTNRFSVFVRDAVVPNTTSTVVTAATGANDSGQVHVVAISGMTRTFTAVRSSGGESELTAAVGPTLNQSALTGNLTLAAACLDASATTLGTPTSWTSIAKDGQTTPTVEIDSNYRTSGFTGTAISFPNSLVDAGGSAGASLAIELDGTSAPLTLSATLADMAGTETAIVMVQGTAADTLSDMTLSSTLTAQTRATTTQTLEAMTLIGTINIRNLVLSATLADMTGTLTAAESLNRLVEGTALEDMTSASTLVATNIYVFPKQAPAKGVSALGDDDLSCIDDIFGEGRTVGGRTALAQALWRRWTTDRGTLIDDKNYGTNLTDFINDDMGKGVVAQALWAACSEAQKDERVLKCDGIARIDRGILFLDFLITDGAGPFDLTVSISSLTVELLKVAA